MEFRLNYKANQKHCFKSNEHNSVCQHQALNLLLLHPYFDNQSVSMH